MSFLMKDRRVIQILLSNALSSIGTGISMIAIPWMLLSLPNGSQLYGYATFGVTFILLLLTPITGILIDRFSRKNLLIWIHGAGFLLLFLFFIVGFIFSTHSTLFLIGIYGVGSLYYGFFFSTNFAFCQEIFPKKHYKSLNGLLEIQSQVSTILSGALASIMLGKIDLHWILLGNIFVFGISLLILRQIPYIQSFQISAKQTFFEQMKTGLAYIKEAPLLFLFLVITFIPFIGVMLTNYLFPIFLHDALNAEPSVYGSSNMMYSIGATLAGFLIPYLLRKSKELSVISLAFAIFVVGLLVISFIPHSMVFLGMQIMLGLGNSGIRIARNSFMMRIIPTDKIGRVNSMLQLIGLVIRLSLLFIFTNSIVLLGIVNILLILSFIVSLAFIFLIISIRFDKLKFFY